MVNVVFKTKNKGTIQHLVLILRKQKSSVRANSSQKYSTDAKR
ncbi:hypothetical protein BTN50_0222 [Candidatus Enterovibrio altilux]|uniref:Mobile element protein n=1 Tax=Candidatus Enterovibrio altilux TaxID=1927128 RepID=A0A291B6Y7_9GAMM|nr:hypothetical protein [Candidatus Enterovibrio luxaltus]ATF08762.1 hypothetical protein BTN50_0222 [Candidatus Enterovibrio luxaltus]